MNKTPEMKFVKKGWGHELWIINKPEYCGKLLFFEKGKRCSWHHHKIKDEVFYLQSGKMMVYYSYIMVSLMLMKVEVFIIHLDCN